MSRLSSHFSVKGPILGSLLFPTVAPSSLATAGDLTYTVAQVLGGLILRDCAGGDRSDTLPTAADLVEAVQGAMVGHAFEFHVRNFSDATETVTIVEGAGGTISGTATIATANTKTFLLVFTNVTAGSEAYTVYSKGTKTY